MTRVLVVDDEPTVLSALERALRLEAYDVELARDGREALDRLAGAPLDAVVLDVAMPGVDGLEVCRRLRRAGDRTPVLMLTARDTVDDRVAGLDAGADDYLVKPFALRELKARLRALLRRAAPAGAGPLRLGDLELDPVSYEVRRGARAIELSRTEFHLLALFLEHPRQVLTRSQIFERVWGYDFGAGSNALGVYVGYLRRKTEAGGEPRLLHTVRGVGYVLKGLMPLRRRMAVATSLAVGVAVLLAAVIAYAVVRGELRGQVDGQLREQAGLVAGVEARFRGHLRPRSRGGTPGRPPGIDVPAPPERRGGGAAYIQLVPPGGDLIALGGDRELPVDERARAVVAGEAGAFLSDEDLEGEHVRVLTLPLAQGGAVQLARSLEGVDAVLARLRWVLLALVAGGVALAAGLGRLAARHLVAPVARVTEAARHIARTEDLGRRIEVTSQDEVGELAARFNGMLDTLEGSIAAQRQLVADASHELRTPVTALRTNLEVLADPGLDAGDRARLLADVQAQAEELGELVGDLMELARGDRPAPASEELRLDVLVGEAVERARRHAPGVAFEAELEPTVLEGVPDRLARAVNNLLDNAAGHSEPGGTISVHAGPGGVRVRDRGTGIAPDDLPHLFDRFYRGAGVRERPGTGLGLAIVRQVAEQHGGRASAANAAGGGAEFVLALPGEALAPANVNPSG